MRQLTCTAPGTVDWREVPEPRLQGDAEALVRPLAVARCDIDLFFTSGFFPRRGPFALGHEAVAEVLALGKAVRGLQVGQRVVVAFQVRPEAVTTRVVAWEEAPAAWVEPAIKLVVRRG